MNDEPTAVPDTVRRAHKAAQRTGFAMSCEDRTGALLATLAASKPDRQLLELDTVTGRGGGWSGAG